MTSPAPYPNFDGTQECAGADQQPFFPDDDRAPAPFAVTATCDVCLFYDPCLAYARTHTVSGIWAGSTEDGRRRWRAKNNVRAVPLVPVDDSRPLWQQAIEMRAEGLRTAVIADQLGISPGSAATLISRHRDHLSVSA